MAQFWLKTPTCTVYVPGASPAGTFQVAGKVRARLEVSRQSSRKLRAMLGV